LSDRKPLWGGRFSRLPAEEALEFSKSIGFDFRLAAQDIVATRAHAVALHKAGVLTTAERGEIEKTLDEAGRLVAEGRFVPDPADEDVHSAIERFLTDRLGETGAKIHAGRSRNDLVAADLRLWIKEAVKHIADGIVRLEQAILGQAVAHAEAVAPGYTHLQRAQPVLLAHLLLAHFFALARDFERMTAAFRRADVSPLGAAALAGTSIPLDVAALAGEAGFSAVFDNAADAVSDRDFALEFLSAAAILGVHLSRLAEEIVLWTSHEFGFARLDDAYSTGSSIMPQKRNSDLAELTRAKAARTTADLMHLLGVMKGLPLAYNRDLQEDKQPVFDAADTAISCLVALAGLLRTLGFDRERLAAAAEDGGATATDLAEALVMGGVPFRTAHEAVGRAVARAASSGSSIPEAAAAELEGLPGFDPEMVRTMDARTSVESRNTHGGTSPERAAGQMARAEAIIDEQQRWLREIGAE
jgi:argininosuccinate lyase